jgi:sugar phosphate isomerase/epimerase
VQLAFSTNAFKRVSLEDALRAIAAAGYGGAEIMADAPHALPAAMPPARVAAVRTLMTELGLGLSNVNAFTLFAVGDTWRPSWIETDEAARRVRVRHTLDALAMAAALGARRISTEPGGPLDGLSRAEGLALFRKGLEEVLPAAEANDVVLTIEPEPGLLIETSEQFLEFIADFGSRHLRLNFDAGHFFCVGEDPAAAAERLAGHIEHVHVEDIAADRTHRHLAPGRGAMDFPSLFAALRRIGYDGWVTVELYPYETTAEQVAAEAIGHLAPLVAAAHT